MARRKTNKAATHQKANTWHQITSSYFCACVRLEAGKVVEAAYIIHYMMGWKLREVKAYCKQRGWEID